MSPQVAAQLGVTSMMEDIKRKRNSWLKIQQNNPHYRPGLISSTLSLGQDSFFIFIF